MLYWAVSDVILGPVTINIETCLLLCAFFMEFHIMLLKAVAQPASVHYSTVIGIPRVPSLGA